MRAVDTHQYQFTFKAAEDSWDELDPEFEEVTDTLRLEPQEPDF